MGLVLHSLRAITKNHYKYNKITTQWTKQNKNKKMKKKIEEKIEQYNMCVL